MAYRNGLTPEERLAIGHAVITLRASNVDWKQLENQFNRSRVMLWRYAHAVLTANSFDEPTNSIEQTVNSIEQPASFLEYETL